MRRRRPGAGFSLIEVSVAFAIAAILAALAWPGVAAAVHKTRRADAVLAAFRVQLAQERFRSRAATYGSLADLGEPTTTAGGHYDLRLGTIGGEGFDLVAEATGAQARDTACRFMRLRLRHATPDYASGPDPQVSNGAAANRRCWNR